MTTNTVPDTQLGLTPDEVQLLRQGQAAAAAAAAAALATGSSSSRAASRASSQGLLLLDGSSLAALGRYFDGLMASIEHKMRWLSEQAQMFTQVQYDAAGNMIDGADAEIARYTEILGQLDELETDFDRIANVKEIIRGYRGRVEHLERSLDASGGGGGGGGSSSSRRGKHSSESSSHSRHHKHSRHHTSSHGHRH